MIISVYSTTDYKSLILDWINHPANKKSSSRKALAEALNCQTPFVSHVLNGDYHFSAEQAEACAQWMHLSEQETNYFILLVLWARAGTKSLKSHLFKQIQRIREDETVLKKKVKFENALSWENQTIYYSSWQYAAVHMALLIPQLRTLDALEDHFKIPQKRLLQIINFLLEMGLIKEENRSFKVMKPMLHLENTSTLLLQHHTHWRLKALESFQNTQQTQQNRQLSYSGAISLSAEDFEWMKQRLSNLLKEVSDKIKDSPDEKLICLNFDCFEI